MFTPLWSLWTIHPTFLALHQTLWSLQQATSPAIDDESLTWGEVLADIPHDAAAFTLYAILGVSLYAVWWGHRNAGNTRDRSERRRAGERHPGAVDAEAASGGDAGGSASSHPEEPEPRPRRPAA